MRHFKAKLILIFGILAILIVLLSVALLFLANTNDDKFANCYNLPESRFGPKDFFLLDCVGYIQINKWVDCEPYDSADCRQVYLYDSLHHNVFVGQVSQYKIINETIYVIGELATKGTGKITAYLPLNGKMRYIEFDDVESIPNYILVDSQNGNLTLFTDFSEMLETDKMIFQELEQ